MNEFPTCAICYREHGPFSKCDFETLYKNVIDGYRAYKSQNVELKSKLEIMEEVLTFGSKHDCVCINGTDWSCLICQCKEAIAKIKGD